LKTTTPREPSVLRGLRELDAEAARRFPDQDWFEKGLQSVALILLKKLVRGYYDWCTPKNCWTFATTGGDGVHFSLLERDGAIADDSPVVVTQPAEMGQSWIVGDKLHDFLCFGASWGFGPFETIGPHWRPTRSWRKSWTPQEEQQRVLDLLIQRFRLKPWGDAKRFRALQETYLKELALPPKLAQ